MTTFNKVGAVALATGLLVTFSIPVLALSSQTDPSIVSIRKPIANDDAKTSPVAKAADAERAARTKQTRAETQARGDEEASSSKKEPASANKIEMKNRTIVAYVSPSHVSTSCFPARLSNILSKVRARYGKQVIVNSGYRSPTHNRRVGGARKSMHVKCMAADIKVPGVNKYTLAKYLKSLPNVGGVGTYGCNGNVHVDVGPKRTWHWRCSRRG